MATVDSKNSIKRVLSLVFLTAVLLLALSVAVLASRQVSEHLKKDAISHAYHLAERLAKDSRLALIQMASENVMSSVELALDLPNIERVTIYNRHGVPLVGHASKVIDFDYIAKANYSDGHALLLQETVEYIFIASPVVIESSITNQNYQDLDDTISRSGMIKRRETIGYILISLNKSSLHNARIEVWQESLFAITMITAIFLVALINILGRITTPVKELAGFMNHPDTAKYYKKAKVFGVKEIREISTAFNGLMVALERANNKLLQSKENLEASVLERTKDLKQARDRAAKYNEENRTLISGMNKTLEEERKFIARELHDHLNADLLFVKLKLRILKTAFKSKPTPNHLTADDANRAIDEMIERISTVYDSSRSIVRLLRPEVIDSLGLVGAIEDRIDMFTSSQPECNIDLMHDGDFSVLDYQFSIAVFRIIQESLTNASKHADASEINIRLSIQHEENPEGLYLCIRDNGKGFNLDRCFNNGIGLISMRERAYALGGKLSVHSTPGEGTEITAKIPLDKNHTITE
jgi:signal transduction histidine kinase